MSQPMKVKIMNEKQLIKIKATSNFPTVNVGGTTDHSKLKNLDYAHSGHTGFVEAEAGKTLSTNDFTNEDKEKLVSLENYTLPIASAETLGGVKIGENLNIDENGVLSASVGGKSLYFNRNDYSKETIEKFQTVYNNFLENGTLLDLQLLNSDKNNGSVYKLVDIYQWTKTIMRWRFVCSQADFNERTTMNTIVLSVNMSNNIITSITNNTYIYGNGAILLSMYNRYNYTPTNDYNPATKKYVDDKLTTITGYDATKTQTLKNINGVLTWQTDGE